MLRFYGFTVLRCYGVTVLWCYGVTVLRFYGVTKHTVLPNIRIYRIFLLPLVYLSASDRQEEKGRFGKVQGVQM